MRRTLNNNLAGWADGLRTKPDGSKLSLRQIETKTGIHYSTVKSLLEGRSVNAEIIILYAEAFKSSIPDALRLAGYQEIAVMWETGAAMPPSGRDEEAESEDDLSQDENELLLYYRGTPTTLRPKAIAILKALAEEDDDEPTTYGKGKKARQ